MISVGLALARPKKNCLHIKRNTHSRRSHKRWTCTETARRGSGLSSSLLIAKGPKMKKKKRDAFRHVSRRNCLRLMVIYQRKILKMAMPRLVTLAHVINMIEIAPTMK